MSVEEYIASGILESYLLDELSPMQAKEVERMAELHPEVKQELHKIELTFLEMSRKVEMAVPDLVKDNLMQQIKVEPKVVSLNAYKKLKYLVAASVTLLIVSTSLAIVYWNAWKTSESQMLAIKQQNEQLADQVFHANKRMDQAEGELNFIADVGTKSIDLKGLERAKEASAKVYWNPSSKEVMLSIVHLPEEGAGQQYQLWAIVDGNPVDMGVFNNVAGLQEMKFQESPDAFAVTLEPAGGSVNPTLEKMYLLGKTG